MSRKRLQNVQQGDEERVQRRYATRDIAVQFPVGAAVIDISESGMGIESGQQLRVGASYVFRVQMGPKSFGLPGKVEWCRFARTDGSLGVDRAPIYKAGVSFSGGPAQETWGQALRRLIESGIQPIAISSAV